MIDTAANAQGAQMISVAIQGGAMRSIYCLGAIRALVDCGLAARVRTVHTASAGCVSGAILAAHITDTPRHVITEVRDLFLDRLAGRRFINPLRLTKVVDVDLLADAIREITAMTPASLSAGGISFEVGLTDAKTGFPRYIELSSTASEADLYQAIRGTMAIPALYPKAIKIDGNRYIDGGISDPLPVLRAFAREPHTLIAISCVARGHLGIELEGYEATVMRFVPFVLSSQVKYRLMVRNPLAAASEDLCMLRQFNNVRIVRIAPADQRNVSHRLDTRRQRLLELEELGYTDGLRALATLQTEHSA